MKCPNCNKKMFDNTCSYCNYHLTEADQIVDKEKENQFKKYSILYLIFIVLGISLSILSTLFVWFLIVSAVILGLLWISGVKDNNLGSARGEGEDFQVIALVANQQRILWNLIHLQRVS